MSLVQLGSSNPETYAARRESRRKNQVWAMTGFAVLLAAGQATSGVPSAARLFFVAYLAR